MATFVLQPCRLRACKIVPIKGSQQLTLNWDELKAKFAPSNGATALRNLRAIRIGDFFGLIRRDGAVTNFVLCNDDRSAKVDWLLKRDPTFEDRLLEVYRVDIAQWDSKVEEMSGTLEP